jgi:hypothetical protein
MKRWLPCLLVLAGCARESSTPASAPTVTVDTTAVATPQEADLGPARLVPLPTHVVFDLRALHNKTISQIRRHLGRPNWDDADPHDWDKTDPQPIPNEWDKTYSEDGIMLNIRYFYHTGKVKYFYLKPQYGCINANPTDLQALLATGNLLPTSPEYRSVPVYYEHQVSSQRYSAVMLAPR